MRPPSRQASSTTASSSEVPTPDEEPGSPTLQRVVFPSLAKHWPGDLADTEDSDSDEDVRAHMRERAKVGGSSRWRHSSPNLLDPSASPSRTFTRTSRTSTTTRVRLTSSDGRGLSAPSSPRSTSPSRSQSRTGATSLHHSSSMRSAPSTPRRGSAQPSTSRPDPRSFLTPSPASSGASTPRTRSAPSSRRPSFGANPPSLSSRVAASAGLSARRARDLARLASTIDAFAKYTLVLSFGFATLAALVSLLLASYGLSAFDDVRRRRRRAKAGAEPEDEPPAEPPRAKPERPSLAVLVPSVLLSLTILGVRSVALLFQTAVQPLPSSPRSRRGSSTVPR